MRKLIDIPDEQVSTLKKLAVEEGLSYKKYLQHIISNKANNVDDFSDLINKTNPDNYKEVIEKYFVNSFSNVKKNRVDVLDAINCFMSRNAEYPNSKEIEVLKQRRNHFRNEAELIMDSNGHRYATFKFECYTDHLASMLCETETYTYELTHDCYDVLPDLNFSDTLIDHSDHWWTFDFKATCNNTGDEERISYFGIHEMRDLRSGKKLEKIEGMI